MVATPSTAAQANEMEKRRKQTLEKAKANHLSRQLQMRLQYARLKVEHGWQKQNLNEVENLYFHHSHQRGTKPYLNSTSILTVSQNDQSTISSPSKFSDPSYRIWLNSLSRSSTMDTVVDAHANTRQDSNGAESNNNSFPSTSSSYPTQSSLSFQNSSLSQSLAPPAELYSSETTQNVNSLVRTPTQSYTALQGNNTTNSLSSSSLPIQTPTTPSHLNGSSGNGIGTPASATKSKKPSSRVQPSHKSSIALSSTDMFNFNSSNLTYDMFWSGLKSYPPKSATPVPGTPGSNSAVSQTNGTNSVNTSVMHLPLPSESLTVPSSSTSSSSSSSTTPSSAVGPSNQNDTLIDRPPTASTSTSTPSQPPPPPPPIASTSTDNQVDHAQNHIPQTVLNWNYNNSSSTSTPATVTASSSTPTPASTSSSSIKSASTSTSIVRGGEGGIPTNLIPASFLSNPAAFPFLASLSASYANTFGTGIGIGENGSGGTEMNFGDIQGNRNGSAHVGMGLMGVGVGVGAGGAGNGQSGSSSSSSSISVSSSASTGFGESSNSVVQTPPVAVATAQKS